VNFATEKAHVAFPADKFQIEDLIKAVQAVGYQAFPLNSEVDIETAKKKRRPSIAEIAFTLLCRRF